MSSPSCAIAGDLSSGPITSRFGRRVPVVAGQLLIVDGLVALLTTAAPAFGGRQRLMRGPDRAGGSLAMPMVIGVVVTGSTCS